MARAVPLFAAALVVLSLAGFAGATSPTHTVIQLPGETFVDFLTCPTFGVSGTFDSRLTLTTFYDNAGNVTGMTGRVHYTGYLFNTSDPSRRVPGDGNFTVFFDAQGNLISQVGVDRHATVPGVGIVDLDAGRIVFDPFTLNGFHDEITGIAPAVLCAALS